MLLTIMFPILLLTSSFSTSQLCPTCSVFSGGFEMRGYTSNDRPVFNNMATPKERFSKGKLKLDITNSWFGIIDINIGMQGWIGAHSFKDGIMGGTWGANMYITDNVMIGYHHFSCHVSDLRNTVASCGSEDSFFIKFTFGLDTKSKYRSSILKKILGG